MLLLVTLVACTPPAQTDAIWFYGCAEIPSEAHCLINDDASLRLWLPPDLTLERLDAPITSMHSGPLDSGTLVELFGLSGEGRIEVHALEDGDAVVWHLDVAPSERPEVLGRASALRSSGDREGAVTLLEAALAETSDPAPILSQLARTLHGAGEDDRVCASLEQSIPGHLAAGRQLQAASDARMRVFYESRSARAAEVCQEELTRMGRRTGSMKLAESRAMLALTVDELLGDTVNGRRHAEEALTWAGRAGRPAAQQEARNLLARLLQAEGQHEAAISQLTASMALGEGCGRATDQLARVWAKLVRRQALGPAASWVPGETLAELDAIEGARTECAGRVRDQSSVALARAWSLWWDDAPHAALTALEHLPDLGGDVEHEMRATELRALLEEQRGQPNAAAISWTRVLTLADTLTYQDMRAHALRGRARARADHDIHAAIDDLVAAEALVSSDGRRVRWRQRDRYLAERQSGYQLLAALWLVQERPDEAVATLRRGRTSYLRSLLGVRELPADLLGRQAELAALRAQLRDAPLDELPALERQERRLLDALDAQVDEAPAATGAGLPPLSPEALVVGFADERSPLRYQVHGDRILLTEIPSEPLEGLDLGGAREVVLHVTGGRLAEDLHVAPVGGHPLIEQIPVRWSLDLPAAPPRAPTLRALVIVDPLEDLADAREEGTLVAEALRARGLEVTALVGPAATPTAVLEALGRGVDVLHVAGHARWDPDGDGALILARGEELSLAEVLLAPVPRVVVLAGCSTASSRELPVASLGIAQAFVVAGADAVLATARPIPDATALSFVRSWTASANDAPVDAFAKATTTLLAEQVPQTSAFRLLTP